MRGRFNAQCVPSGLESTPRSNLGEVESRTNGLSNKAINRDQDSFSGFSNIYGSSQKCDTMGKVACCLTTQELPPASMRPDIPNCSLLSRYTISNFTTCANLLGSLYYENQGIDSYSLSQEKFTNTETDVVCRILSRCLCDLEAVHLNKMLMNWSSMD